jgi:uncharacterized protein YggU (UPF0235/DUF167 family)
MPAGRDRAREGAAPVMARREAGPLIIEVKVRPNARSSGLEPAADGGWLARLRAAPVEGRANQELIALVARHFGCPKSAVSIKAGASGRRKLVRIERD